MKLELTKEQYWHLLRATYMADWMANAICTSDMEQDEDIKKIRNHVFSLAEEMGYGNYVTFDEERNTYYANFDLDDEASVRLLIDRYDEHNFWMEMVEYLGDRDFLSKYSKEEIEAMSDEERFSKRLNCDEKWEREFEEHGVDRLDIVDSEK